MAVILSYFHIILLKKASTAGVFSVDSLVYQDAPQEKTYTSWTMSSFIKIRGGHWMPSCFWHVYSSCWFADFSLLFHVYIEVCWTCEYPKSYHPWNMCSLRMRTAGSLESILSLSAGSCLWNEGLFFKKKKEERNICWPGMSVWSIINKEPCKNN